MLYSSVVELNHTLTPVILDVFSSVTEKKYIYTAQNITEYFLIWRVIYPLVCKTPRSSKIPYCAPSALFPESLWQRNRSRLKKQIHGHVTCSANQMATCQGINGIDGTFMMWAQYRTWGSKVNQIMYGTSKLSGACEPRCYITAARLSLISSSYPAACYEARD